VDRASGGATDPGGAIPPPVRALLETLWTGGHGAWVVGGSLRDTLLGREATDWDLATDARPERMLELFPGAVYENRFGTVAVRRGRQVYEITTFRSDHDYADYRRPHRVEFGDELEPDLARRDFTVNAMAWGAAPADGRPAEPALADPFGGTDDLRARVLRAVGDPDRRFGEDALRMVRAVRLATVLGFEIEPTTLRAITANAELVRHLSGERIAAELDKLLAAPSPGRGLRLLTETGLLAHALPELEAQRGVAQNKVPGDDLWAHTIRTVEAAPAGRPVLRLAALLHDIGKPSTAADGHFYGHDRVGADLARAVLERLRYPRTVIDRVVRLVRQHMFTYEAGWSDAAVRRFIGKIGRDHLDELFDLREADNVGSGQPSDASGLDELRGRVAAQLEAEVAIDRGDLAVNGDDLIAELGLTPGPRIGRVLDELLDRVINDPALNDRATLLLLARSLGDDEPNP
jgi:putative nucleotidyltransferase with HDIG domain